MNFAEEVAAYRDTKENALDIRDRFIGLTNATPALKAHRDFVERMWWGFGERALHWMWKLLVDEMPQDFKFLEIGVYCGQVITLVRMLGEIARKEADVYGVTMLSSFGGADNTFPETDYKEHIAAFHRHFALQHATLFVGDSTTAGPKTAAINAGPYDLLYIDGCHDYDFVLKDCQFYPQLIKPGGYLVIDDCACKKKQPWGFFQGIATVCKAVEHSIERNPDFKELFCVTHNRIWQRGE